MSTRPLTTKEHLQRVENALTGLKQVVFMQEKDHEFLLRYYKRNTAKAKKAAKAVKAMVGVYFDENGELLWHEQYILSRCYEDGGTFVHKGVGYTVVSSNITHGKLGGALVEYVVKETDVCF